MIRERAMIRIGPCPHRPMIRIGIVAGEASGDRLAAGLIAALRARFGAIEVEGVAGPAVIAEGCRALYPSERLA